MVGGEGEVEEVVTGTGMMIVGIIGRGAIRRVGVGVRRRGDGGVRGMRVGRRRRGGETIVLEVEVGGGVGVTRAMGVGAGAGVGGESVWEESLEVYDTSGRPSTQVTKVASPMRRHRKC